MSDFNDFLKDIMTITNCSNNDAHQLYKVSNGDLHRAIDIYFKTQYKYDELKLDN